MPEWLAVVLLGIVEGLTEFIPISSTGHLLVAEHWFRIQFGLMPQSDLFNVVIQSGAVLAVLPLFRPRLNQFFTRWREVPTQRYLAKIFLAFAITAVGGLILEKKHFRLTEDLLRVALAMVIGGVLLIAAEWMLRKRQASGEVTWTVAVIVGVAQLLAIIFPGASRSGMTIIAALIVGLGRRESIEFSFLVGIPTLLAAGGFKVLSAILKHRAGTEDWFLMMLATLVAGLVSFSSVKWLLGYIQTHTFIGFGIYRILAGILVIFFLA